MARRDLKDNQTIFQGELSSPYKPTNARDTKSELIVVRRVRIVFVSRIHVYPELFFWTTEIVALQILRCKHLYSLLRLENILFNYLFSFFVDGLFWDGQLWYIILFEKSHEVLIFFSLPSIWEETLFYNIPVQINAFWMLVDPSRRQHYVIIHPSYLLGCQAVWRGILTYWARKLLQESSSLALVLLAFLPLSASRVGSGCSTCVFPWWFSWFFWSSTISSLTWQYLKRSILWCTLSSLSCGL